MLDGLLLFVGSCSRQTSVNFTDFVLLVPILILQFLFVFFFHIIVFIIILQVVLSYDAYTAELSTVPYKFINSDGFYTALPFVTSYANATSAAPKTTGITLSSAQNNNPYAFTTTSVDYPALMPISFVFTLLANYSNTFTNYQCFTTLPPSLEPSSSPSLSPSGIPSSAPSLSPSLEPSVAPNVIITRKPTAEPSMLPSMVFYAYCSIFRLYFFFIRLLLALLLASRP